MDEISNRQETQLTHQEEGEAVNNQNTPITANIYG